MVREGHKSDQKKFAMLNSDGPSRTSLKMATAPKGGVREQFAYKLAAKVSLAGG
ncbi:hypothetical protein NKI19_30570 [Mesorhizobium sp. M0751]|uniref:hypothetical protein n=1 Tax=unclassified Mesorhizobium TaxID=325217 RepID=UPI0033374702